MPAVDSAVVLAVATAGCAMAVGAAVMKVFSVVIDVVTGSNCGTEPHDVMTGVEEELDCNRLTAESCSGWMAP